MVPERTKEEHREPTQAVCLFMSKYKEMYGRILKSLNIVNLYRGMSKLKLKLNVKVSQLLCIVVSVALNGEYERFGGFCVIATVNAKPTKSLKFVIQSRRNDNTQQLGYFYIYFEL